MIKGLCNIQCARVVKGDDLSFSLLVCLACTSGKILYTRLERSACVRTAPLEAAFFLYGWLMDYVDGGRRFWQVSLR